MSEALFNLLAIVFFIGAIVFFTSLVLRLVRAVENIAGQLSVMNQTHRET
ncbi:MAG: hypothetical protein JXB48_06870 [Candidatus Latescibacteria bacterium]|nr:hypothetical protein [Candidatus Latescibacterota bacterium]